MDVAGLLDREISLIDRSMAGGPKAHLLGERSGPEQVESKILRFVIEDRIDAVADEHCEPDLLECIGKGFGKACFVRSIAPEEGRKIERRDRAS